MNNPPHDRKRIFISGPMTGIQWFNFHAFDEARNRVEAMGHIAVSPADLDRMVGLDPFRLPHDWDWTKMPAGFSLEDAIDRDIDALKQCDGILLLEGHENSVGSRAEKAYADWRRIPEFKL